ncbi:MAG: LysR substrate-binding domain-containing protein [Pseudomonadota bacterium]
MQPAVVDTDLIRTFVAVCDAGSFRGAADRVHRTPSAISMQMAKLEDQVSAELFRKDGRSVKLSAVGEEFLGYARRILSLQEEALARVARPKLSGMVRFGAPDDYELGMLTDALPRFTRLCPDAEIEVHLNTSMELLSLVEAGNIDLALLEVTSVPRRDPGEIVRAEPLVWLGCEGGTAKLRRPLPLALPGKNCHWRHAALDALERSGVAYRMAYSCKYSHGQVGALQADLAVSALPASYNAPGLERIAPEVGLPRLGTVSVSLAVAPEADDTARALAEILRENATQSAAVGIA